MPLLGVIALTAGYAMYVRIDAHGLTVGRFWACVVAAAAGVYAFGYAWVAARGSSWMAGIERINIAAGLFLIAVIALALTPALSPYRLAAASQFQRALQAPPIPSQDGSGEHTPLEYLRFEAGGYGRARLTQLANLQDHPRAAEIVAAANAMIARENRWSASVLDARQRLAGILVHPAGRSLEPELIERISSDLDPDGDRLLLRSDMPVSGLFVDLDGDAAEEFVLLSAYRGLLYARRSDRGWYRAGQVEGSKNGSRDLAGAVKRGAIRVVQPRWRSLEVGDASFRVTEEGQR
jgi:hypothetical protein